MFDFTITTKNKRARTGTITPPHVALQMPLFTPVGPQATVKTLSRPMWMTSVLRWLFPIPNLDKPEPKGKQKSK